MKYLELEYEELLENEYFNMDDDSYDDPGSDDSGDPGDTSGDSGGGEETESSSSMASNARKKAMETVSKALKQKAKKMSLAKPLGMLLWKIFFILVIIIIIIGIIMFLATMPGMVMENLKNISRKVGNAFASFFGADTTYQVSNEEIYEALTYIENMGYDLKGNGYLTGYVGDDGSGVEKDDDGKIINAISDFIFTYMVSENYVYTIANQNLDTSENGILSFWDGIQGMLARLAEVIIGGQARQYWARGFISIYSDNGVLGHKGDYYRNNWLTGDKIVLNAESKTLEIKRGHFNNSVTYNLDGWTGRYGVPMDFLISLQQATLMPDLSYDIATNFETQLLMLLHPLDHGTAIGYYKNDNGEYVSWDKFHEQSTSGFLDGWRINREEAKKIMDNLHISSPENCLGSMDATDKEPINNVILFSTEQNANGEYINNSTQEEDVVEKYNLMMDTLRTYGYQNNMSNLPSSISSFDSFVDILPNVNETVTKKLEWINDSVNENYSEYMVEIKLSYVDREILNGGYQDADGVVDNYTREHKAIINYTITKIWSMKKIQEYLLANGISTPEEAKCSNIADKTKTCEYCRYYIQKIYNQVKNVDVSNWQIYQPYIANVTDHWYRDVYFVSAKYLDPTEFVETDYDYEAIMKERWTLYETDSNGDYVLYELDENGEYKEDGGNLVVYDGTQEEAKEAGIAVAKKAITSDITTQYEDLGWNQKNENIEDGSYNYTKEIYSAYVLENQVQKEFAKVHLDVSGDSLDSQIKDRLYVELQTIGNVVQTGEGQRTETNPKIKKMFLQNSYFRYDGSSDTAELITKLRKAIADADVDNKGNTYQGFGALSDAELELLKNGIEIDGKTYIYNPDEIINTDGSEQIGILENQIGKVVLNQDSLTAFSMLENTHTLDSDYIYRDFKELVVELGYFTKEELTDETPRLLQFLIPDIPNGGYPESSIDKTEYVDNGTMIHSKYDIDANKKNTLMELAKHAYLAEPPEDAFVDEVGVVTKNIETKEFLDNKNFFIQYASLAATPMANFANVGAIQDISETNYEVEIVSTASEKGIRKAYATVNGVRYEVWSQTSSTCTLYSFAFIANAYTGEEFDKYIKATYGTPNALVNQTGNGQGGNDYWVQGAGFAGKTVLDAATGGGQRYEPGTPNIGEKVAEALGKGIPVYFYGRYLASGNNHAIVLLGKSENGVLFYNPGGGYIGVCDEFGGTFEANLQTLVSPTYFNHWIYIPDVAPEGTSIFGNSAGYNGFSGNEAVVSPVTGILLEYGTYDSEIENTETGEEYRVNVDLKYISPFEQGNSDTTTTEEVPSETGETTNVEESTNGRSVSDKVGYAKILVLDKTYYETLETKLLASYTNSDILEGVLDVSEGFLNSNGSFERNAIETEEMLEKIEYEGNPNKYLEQTLYGYKEFAELYEDFGIAGYTIYIDGFKCELPDEDFEADANMETEEIPDGENLNMNTFKISVGNLEDPGELIQTKYEMPEKYKMSSKTATERLNVEEILKAAASPAVSVDNIIYIKEGTVIGRTYTDKEVITELRGENIEDYISSEVGIEETPETGSEGDAEETQEPNNNKLIGNYLRISMKTNAINGEKEKDIENVEDYMKLDEAGGGKTGVYGDLEAITESSTDVEKVRAAMSYFIEQGFTPEAAAGIVGNLIQESALDPRAVSAAGYRGLAQWSTSWWPTQTEWMASQGYNEESFAGQIRSIYESPNTGSISVGGGYEAMKVLTNIDQATEFFIVYYEGCVGGSDPTQYYKVGTNYQETNNRKRFAHNAYNIYMGNNSIGIKD